MSPSSAVNSFDACPFLITAISTRKENSYLDALYQITTELLDQRKIDYQQERTRTEWKIEVKNLTQAMWIVGSLFQQHTYIEARKEGVDLFASAKTEDPELSQHAIRIGDCPPTSTNLKGYYEVYIKEYLRSHSLPSTRLVHTVATILGVSLCAYGIFNGNWWCILGGIGGIYEAGFHSHLFLEKNIPSSTKYPKESVYGDFRVTIQTLLNPFTGGMDKDLRMAGIQ